MLGRHAATLVATSLPFAMAIPLACGNSRGGLVVSTVDPNLPEQDVAVIDDFPQVEVSAPPITLPPPEALLFGGAGKELYGDTWTLTSATWAADAGPGPSARSEHAIAGDLLFGGNDGVRDLADTWTWSGGTGWTQVNVAGPSARRGHTMVGDSKYALLYGGRDSTGILDDTWVWDGTRWSQLAVSGPGPRYGHAMTSGILFGGEGAPADTWRWDGTTWTKLDVAGPSARAHHTMATLYVPFGIFLFGGQDATGNVLSDTWTLGSQWTQLAPVATPPARARHCMAANTYDKLWLFGGSREPDGGAPFFGDTWRWDGTGWTELSDGGPSPRGACALGGLPPAQ